MALYPDDIRSLLADCECYMKRELDLETLKSRIWNTSRVVVAYEERELRQHLMRSEAELDTIQFTTDRDQIFHRTLEVVTQLQDILLVNLAS